MESSERTIQTKRRTALVLLVAALLLFTALFFPGVFSGLLLIFAGVLFGILLNRSSAILADLIHVKYGAAFAIVVIALLALIACTALFMGTRITQQVAELSDQFAAASLNVEKQMERYGLDRWLPRQNQESGGLPRTLLSTAGSAVMVSVSTAGSIVLVAFLGFYFALQPAIYHSGILALVPARSRQRIDNVARQATTMLWYWMLGRLVGMTLIGVVTGVGLWLLGIPLPITLAVIAGLLNFVPNLGPIIASIPAIVFALQQSPVTAMYVAGFYLVLQFVESYFVTPIIDQQQVRLPPGLILAAQLIMGLIAGILGLLLATPLTVVLYVLIRELYVKDIVEANA